MAAALQKAMDDTLRRLRPRPTSEAQAATGKNLVDVEASGGRRPQSSAPGL